ncbi:MAG: tryptophan 7-halogenase [Chloroflexota bacterium]
MNNDSFDVIVMGGGPAGSTVSTLVAMQGHNVLLLEREQSPRYQVGESLLPSTIHGICPMLGVAKEIQNANFTYKRGATLRWGKNPDLWHIQFDNSFIKESAVGYAYQVERTKFDHILLQNARTKGVNVREQHRVRELLTEGDRVVGVQVQDHEGTTYQARAKVVVDAAGHSSPHYRQVGERVYSEFFKNIALYGYYNGGKRLPGELEGNILAAAFEWGWFWYIPLADDLTSVGAVIAQEYAHRLNQQGHESVMHECIDACPIIREYLASAERITDGLYGELRIRKDYSYCNTKFWKPGLVLVGDAACFIDPILSSGVHMATYSALLAARSINSLLRGDFDEERCFAEFEARYRNEFAKFYQMLIAFYDTNQHEDSYFWSARSILNTTERDNSALVTLASGVSSSELVDGQLFFDTRGELGSTFQMILDELGKGPPPPEASAARRVDDIDDYSGMYCQIPGFENAPLQGTGLVASEDGFYWRESTS